MTIGVRIAGLLYHNRAAECIFNNLTIFKEGFSV